MFVFIFVFAITIVKCQLSPDFERVFGDGQIQDFHKEQSETFLAASMHDLIALCEYERQITGQLKDAQLEDGYLQAVQDIGARNGTCQEHMFHPINAYQCVKRFGQYLRHLPQLPDKYVRIFKDPVRAQSRAIEGIFNIQDYFHLNPQSIADGNIGGYISKSKLKTEDLLLLLNSLLEDDYLELLDRIYLWAVVLKKVAKAEGIESTLVEDIVVRSKKYYLDMVQDYKSWISAPIENEHQLLKEFQKQIQQAAFGSLDADLGDNLLNALVQRQRSRLLCQMKFDRPESMNKDLFCRYLHHGNPYLKVGPMKYEMLNRDPEVSLVQDFIHDKEIEYIVNASRDHLYTTPYSVAGKTEYASKYRLSKVHYINEMQDAQARKISDRIELLTGFVLRKTQFDSENYQVMNYGLGGKISSHCDSRSGDHQAKSERGHQYGGPRIMTFMMYLTSVRSGGQTVFPNLGLSVKPRKGSALFWFNFQANGLYNEPKIEHLGCPVIMGNKWIANKWIKFNAQFQNYRCHWDKNFSIHN